MSKRNRIHKTSDNYSISIHKTNVTFKALSRVPHISIYTRNAIMSWILSHKFIIWMLFCFLESVTDKYTNRCSTLAMGISRDHSNKSFLFMSPAKRTHGSSCILWVTRALLSLVTKFSMVNISWFSLRCA